MRSWLADRSHCHCTLLGSRRVSASAIASPVRKLASAPSRSPCLLQDVAEAVVAHRQVVLPAEVAAGSRLASASAISRLWR